MPNLRRAKVALRSAIGAPGIRDGLRWFINEPAIPARLRSLAHRKIAKRARFAPDRAFEHITPTGVHLRFFHSGTSNYLYWLDEYEPETTSLFSRLARTAQTILDIGAADGLYAILAAAENPSARILAFEPGRGAAAMCARNIALNLPLTKNIELRTLALGETDEDTTLYVAGASGGNSSLNPEFRSVRVEETVTVRRGDFALADLGVARVDLIKADTESTEPAVLRGLHTTLVRDRPDVICEVLRGRTENELENILRPLGYRYFHITSTGLEAKQSIAGDAEYQRPNYLFTHRSDRELAELSADHEANRSRIRAK